MRLWTDSMTRGRARRWWQDADAPWQCLAACMEVRDALASGDPASFRSRLPVQMDGSCNGLQHYAALSRDEPGGRSVNLLPVDRPQAGTPLTVFQHDRGRGQAAAASLPFFISEYTTVVELLLCSCIESQCVFYDTGGGVMCSVYYIPSCVVGNFTLHTWMSVDSSTLWRGRVAG